VNRKLHFLVVHLIYRVATLQNSLVSDLGSAYSKAITTDASRDTAFSGATSVVSFPEWPLWKETYIITSIFPRSTTWMSLYLIEMLINDYKHQRLREDGAEI